MREMNTTGFMPNRGRMIVASYFSLDIKQDWRYGAYYFEERLIDYDAASNYNNWAVSSGLGPGPVPNLNIVEQSKELDPEGDYIKLWCPELNLVPKECIHNPWDMPYELQKEIGVIIGE